MNDTVMMTPDVCMQFLVWSYYYHDFLPEKDKSYRQSGRFSDADANRLDELKDTLFLCFTEESVANACKQFQLAKIRKEPCPFSQAQLDGMFAKERE